MSPFDRRFEFLLKLCGFGAFRVLLTVNLNFEIYCIKSNLKLLYEVPASEQAVTLKINVGKRQPSYITYTRLSPVLNLLDLHQSL